LITLIALIYNTAFLFRSKRKAFFISGQTL
jgi:hypothetical protein